MNYSNYSKINSESKSFSRNRRLKSFLFLLSCFGIAIYPHFIEEQVFSIIVIFISLVVATYGLVVIAKNNSNLNFVFGQGNKLKQEELPFLDILVAARDEQNVISDLVERLFCLDYPCEKLNIYIIDDGSSDDTPTILDKLSKKFDKLNIIRRLKHAGGGKSGALNYALKY